MADMCRSLLPVDIGFDLRDTGHMIRIYEGFGYTFLDRSNKKTFVDPNVGLVETAEILARNRYTVVLFSTPTGGEVFLTPDESSDKDIRWYVRLRYDDGWWRGDTMEEALSKSGWTADDIRPLSSDEYV